MLDHPAIAIGLGMIISLILTESVGVTAGGLIVPGYIALSLHNPYAVIFTFCISLLTLLLLNFLSRFIIIYGKRRLVFCLILSFTLGSFIRDIPEYFITYKPGGEFFLSGLLHYLNTNLYNFNSFLSSYSGEMIYIGWLIPGLIASWMDRQGVLPTISTILIISSLINLILMVLGKYV
tara:strand:+ start:812 stop:1345 length:534 start_codon:yes stop_codon:yes gene_type:complete